MFALKVERTSPLVATQLHEGTARQTTDILHVYSTPFASSPISPPTPPPLICFIPQCLLRTCLNTGIFCFWLLTSAGGEASRSAAAVVAEQRSQICRSRACWGSGEGKLQDGTPQSPNSVNGGGQNEPPSYARKMLERGNRGQE